MNGDKPNGLAPLRDMGAVKGSVKRAMALNIKVKFQYRGTDRTCGPECLCRNGTMW